MMHRCMQLAENGLGRTAPNPLVGCVITYNGKIIGEGYHRYYGGAHAEVNAIASVKDASLLPKATLYVNLEPCSHYGKTPPCTELIIKKQIPRIVIANTDPYAEVSGSGIRKLKAAGREVISGVLEKEGQWLNRRFFTFHTRQRPYLILKWAESTDGYLDARRREKDGQKPAWLTNQAAKHMVHKWRNEEQAVLVGQNTALLDNPRLNIREWQGHNPVRVLIDPELKVSTDANIFDKNAQTLIFNHQREADTGNINYIRVSVETDMISGILDRLYQLKIHSVIIEGGAYVLNRFIAANMWDEARRFVGEVHLGDGVNAPKIKCKAAESCSIGASQLYFYYNTFNK